MSDVGQVQDLYQRTRDELSKVIVGQESTIELLLVAMLCEGHVLVEGVPGTAKTLLVRALASLLGCRFNRVQFTPDLMPSDVTGTSLFHLGEGVFKFREGPIFSNFLLGDEINRAPAKTQSALLQAMEEAQVTVDGTTYDLPEPFIVVATQNPIEQEGTYPLPEAQIDRFMFKVLVDYPSKEEEYQVLERVTGNPDPDIKQVLTIEQIMRIRKVVETVYMDEKVKRYIVDIVFATRRPKEYGLEEIEGLVEYGASPRATIFLAMAAKAHAFIRKRGYVIPEDIKLIGPDVLRHRIILTYEAEAEEMSTDDIVRKIFEHVKVP